MLSIAMKKTTLAIAGVIGASASVIVGIGAAEAMTFSYTSETQTGTLWSPNELIFEIDDAPAAVGDVALGVAAFGDLNWVQEYVDIFGRGKGEANWTSLGRAFSDGIDYPASTAYNTEFTTTKTIPLSQFNDWIAAGNGDIEIKLTPSAGMGNDSDDPDEYAFISLNYEKVTSVPEPTAVLGLLAVGSISAGLLKRKGK